MREKGTGRTRLGRFAAITVPAAVITAGLGVAVVQGMIGATLSSASGFNLESPSLQASTMAVTPGGTNTAGGEKEAVFARVNSATLNTMCIGASENLPSAITGLAKIGGLDVASLGVDLKSSSNVALPSVDLNAASLTAGTATDTSDGSTATTNLTDAAVGVAQSDAKNAFAGAPDLSTGNSNYSQNDFALVGSGAKLYGVSAQSYAITLHGLNLSNLSLTPKTYSSTTPTTCTGFDNTKFSSANN